VSEKEQRVVDDEITFLPLFCSKIGHTTWERTFILGLSLSPALIDNQRAGGNELKTASESR
jgi:hypothetical protein